MTQLSGFWTTTGTASGHQQASYTQAHWSTAAEILAACSGFEGVAPGYLNELACSDGGADTVDVATGGAVVDGKWYKNDAEINQSLNRPAGGYSRIDRLVIRCTWANFEAVLTVIEGTASTGTPVAPSITQTTGTTYDILLCQALIDDAGAVTITDERVWSQGDDNSLAASAVTTAKIAADAVTNAKIADDQIDSEHYVDGSIDLAHLAAGASKLTKRQGGSSTIWATTGTTDYTPTEVNFQAGRIDLQAVNANDDVAVTFPTAFAYAPIVIISCQPTSALTSVDFSICAHSVSTTGFTAAVFTNSYGTVSYPISWLAIGDPA